MKYALHFDELVHWHAGHLDVGETHLVSLTKKEVASAIALGFGALMFALPIIYYGFIR